MTTQREPNHHPNINKVVTALAGRKKKGAEGVQNSDVCGKLVDGRYKCLYLAQILALELTDAGSLCSWKSEYYPLHNAWSNVQTKIEQSEGLIRGADKFFKDLSGQKSPDFAVFGSGIQQDFPGSYDSVFFSAHYNHPNWGRELVRQISRIGRRVPALSLFSHAYSMRYPIDSYVLVSVYLVLSWFIGQLSGLHICFKRRVSSWKSPA